LRFVNFLLCGEASSHSLCFCFPFAKFIRKTANIPFLRTRKHNYIGVVSPFSFVTISCFHEAGLDLHNPKALHPPLYPPHSRRRGFLGPPGFPPAIVSRTQLGPCNLEIVPPAIPIFFVVLRFARHPYAIPPTAAGFMRPLSVSLIAHSWIQATHPVPYDPFARTASTPPLDPVWLPSDGIETLGRLPSSPLQTLFPSLIFPLSMSEKLLPPHPSRFVRLAISSFASLEHGPYPWTCTCPLLFSIDALTDGSGGHASLVLSLSFPAFFSK